MTTDPSTEAELVALAGRIEDWLARQLAENPVVAAVERDEESGERRWFVRVLGEQKDVFTIWFHLRQRTLHYETYVMPAPEENEGALYQHLLRRNVKLYGAAFAIGDEEAIFLVGQIANAAVDEEELDRILGSLYQWVEQFFQPALRIGFASHFSR
jgi:Putative bacterial sensory transduction regulator